MINSIKETKKTQGSGEFYIPTSLVKLTVEVIEPYKGRILDPACGSGGMFVQSARFVGNRNSIRLAGSDKDFLIA